MPSCGHESNHVTEMSNNGQVNSRRLDPGDASPSRHTPSPGTGLGILNLLGYPRGKPRNHGLQRAMQYPNPPTKTCCRAMLYDVTQIYNILVQASALLPNA